MIPLLFCVLWLSSACLAENVITFHIMEELPVGTLIGNIGLESGLQGNLTDDELSRVRYNFLDQSDMRSLFAIHENTGNILIKSPVDREAECTFLDVCVLSFDVAVHSSNPQMFRIYLVQITIEDRNDNSPQFPSDKTTLNIQESAMVGTTFSLDEAIDIDSTLKNVVQRYELVHEADVFRLNTTKDLDGRFSLQLILQTKLDREIKDGYLLELLGFDGGEPVRTGTLTIFVNVADDNDNSPVFELETYKISINEGTKVQTPLIAVTAHDKDTGANGEIVYRFNPRQLDAERISQMFSIDGETGVIYVKGEILYGKLNVYEISVEASDKGSQPRTSYTTVTITVLDTTNNRPEVLINFLVPANDSFVSLSEAAEAGTVIAHVTAEDTDSGLNGQVICGVSNEYVTLQNISGKPGYLIVLTKNFDREVKQEHYIFVTCSDNGTPKLSSSESFILQVLDENDNKPEFFQAVYSAKIDENNPKGKYCVKVSASDADVWPNDDIHYSLVGDSENAFYINSRTGIITATQVLDRESREEYRLTVLAVDGGSPSLTGTAVVVIVVKDVNDNRPEFDVPFFQFFIQENQPIDTIVGLVNAHDSDTGNNKNINFALIQTPGENLPFTINSVGELRSTAPFDREEDNSFIFEIIATDQGLPPLASKIFVRVYITDENDNRPTITYPDNFNRTIEVTYSTAAGTYLTTVVANDKDENGPNSQLTYEIVAGNEEDIFSISRTSGKIYLKRQLETKSMEIKSVTVSVSDNGKVPFTTNVTFSIVLKYIEPSSAVSNYNSDSSGKKNVIISIAVVSMTIVISGALIGVICILRRSEKIRKKLVEEHEKQKYGIPKNLPEPVVKSQNEINLQENLSYQEPIPEKKKEISSSYDEDLDNMELYSSFGTSVFTDTLPGLEKPGQSMTEQRIIKRSSLKHVLSDEQISGIHSLDDISEISGEGDSEHTDSGRGSSDPDLTHPYYAERNQEMQKARPTEKLPMRYPKRDHANQHEYEQKYYGFVDRPNRKSSGHYPGDLKVVRFNENGQFCVETSSFV